MAQSFEKSVKGATKVKVGPKYSLSASLTITRQLAPPKSKYIEHILIATHGGEAGVNEVFRVLQNRLRDSTWTVVFKSLIVVHLLIREGRQDAALKHLSNNPQRTLAINNFTEGACPLAVSAADLYQCLSNRQLCRSCVNGAWQTSANPRPQHPSLYRIPRAAREIVRTHKGRLCPGWRWSA